MKDEGQNRRELKFSHNHIQTQQYFHYETSSPVNLSTEKRMRLFTANDSFQLKPETQRQSDVALDTQ